MQQPPIKLFRRKDSFLEGLFLRYMSDKLPKKFKRMIYLSSIAAFMEQKCDPDSSLARQINSIMRLAKYPDSMIFPMYIKTAIWKNIGSNPIVTNTGKFVKASDILDKQEYRESEDVAVHFVSYAPEWLRYADPSVMLNDVMDLIHTLKTIRRQPAM
jgi:hypothetical protein